MTRPAYQPRAAPRPAIPEEKPKAPPPPAGPPVEGPEDAVVGDRGDALDAMGAERGTLPNPVLDAARGGGEHDRQRAQQLEAALEDGAGAVVLAVAAELRAAA